VESRDSTVKSLNHSTYGKWTQSNDDDETKYKYDLGLITNTMHDIKHSNFDCSKMQVRSYSWKFKHTRKKRRIVLSEAAATFYFIPL
jgi:hypothetical protein